jgi:O-antigen ligase
MDRFHPDGSGSSGRGAGPDSTGAPRLGASYAGRAAPRHPAAPAPRPEPGPSRLAGPVLALVAAYLVLGNVPRFIAVPGFGDNLLVTEGLVYAAVGACALLRPTSLRFALRLAPVYLLILASFLYGCLVHGFEVKPMLYAARLILLVFSATVAGFFLAERHGADADGAYAYLVRIYVLAAALGFAIYVAFPDSTVLWALLAGFNIEFHGDPHQHRLVSTYFDPNYYAAIACLPLLLCAFLYAARRETRWAAAALVLALSIVLTGSRSGIATMIATVGIVVFTQTLRVLRTTTVRWSTLALLPATAIALVVASPVYADALATTWDRLAGMANDASALTRIASVQFGMEVLAERPLLGLGYNYLAGLTQESRGLSSVDSSVQATLIHFGVIPTALLVLLLTGWAVGVGTRLGARPGIGARLGAEYRQWIAYVVLIVAFTSHFNNVLYYQFWLFPTAMLGAYVVRLSHGRRDA